MRKDASPTWDGRDTGMVDARAEAYEGWAIVELMGHRRLGGRVSEAVQYGVAMLRVDVPKPCTGISADWCPLHGTCKCANKEERLTNPEAPMDDLACPLHAPTSDHEEGAVTQFYGGSAIYCVTPCDETAARAAALGASPEPVSRYEVRALTPPTDRARNGDRDVVPDDDEAPPTEVFEVES